VKRLTAWDIQNEMLELAAHSVLRRIIGIVKQAKFFSLVIDETSDCSVKEQVSISVRIANESYEAEEYFLGHYETTSTTGESLEIIITDALQRFGFSMDDLRGQCYDGAANMSGQFKGVQARILKLQPKAIYVHCLNHSLNLALQTVVSKNPYFRDLMSCVHEVGTLLQGSPKRMGEFQAKLGSNNPNMTKPRPLCPTRWTVRVKSIEGLLTTYKESLDFLEDLKFSKENVSYKAAGIHSQMEKGDFYLGLLMAKTLFYSAECLSKTLQDPKATVSGGIQAASIAVQQLLSLKSMDVFQKLWIAMEEKISELSLEEPALPRCRKKSKRVDNSTEPPKTFSDAKERLMFIFHEAIETMCEEIGTRFDQKGIQIFDKLEIALLTASPGNESALEEVSAFYGWDAERVSREMAVLRAFPKMDWSSTNKIIECFRNLQPESRSMFPFLQEYFKTILVIPCSSAGAERSFSTLRRIKSYLRSTMCQKRLNHCCVVNAYPDIVDNINIDSMLQEFVSIKGRSSTFGSFMTM